MPVDPEIANRARRLAQINNLLKQANKGDDKAKLEAEQKKLMQERKASFGMEKGITNKANR